MPDAAKSPPDITAETELEFAPDVSLHEAGGTVKEKQGEIRDGQKKRILKKREALTASPDNLKGSPGVRPRRSAAQCFNKDIITRGGRCQGRRGGRSGRGKPTTINFKKRKRTLVKPTHRKSDSGRTQRPSPKTRYHREAKLSIPACAKTSI